MSISKNIKDKSDDIHMERLAHPMPQDPHPIADEVKNKAISAILGTPDDWTTFVTMFAKNEAELALLMPSNNPVKREAQAYLAANAMCGFGTGDRLLDNVSTKLDV